MIKIISFKICPFVQRVTALLEAKQLPYEIEYISLKNKPQWFLELSPNGQVPVLVTDAGTALFESDAIVEYIDDISAPLESKVSPEQKAIDRAWSYQAAKHYLVQCSAMRSADEATLIERTHNLGKAFAKVEKLFVDRAYRKGEYFKGSKLSNSELSNVDIAWLPLLHRANIIEQHTGYDFLANYPHVKLWQSTVMSTGLAEKSVAVDFEKAFTDFYLSDQTFLGCGQNCEPNADSACSSGSCC